MTVLAVDTPDALDDGFLRLTDSLRWWDPDTECELILTQPKISPGLWSQFGEQARRSYRKHGVECALDTAALQSGADTALFMTAIADDGQLLGGVRAKGPLNCADDAHAVVEWEGQAGAAQARKMITDRLPFGVLELKSAWVADAPKRHRGVTTSLARFAAHAMTLLRVQFCVCTAASHVLDRWRSSGGVIATGVPPTPYPDARYQTRMMWWDRRTYANHADPDQLAKVHAETRRTVQFQSLNSEVPVHA